MDGARTGGSRTEAILDATVRLIGARGPQAVTHRAVAAEAGVSLGRITHHFAGREALLEAAMRHLAQRETAERDRLTLELAESGADRETWIALIADHLAGEPGDVPGMLATYEMLLECARNPALRDALHEWTRAQTRLVVLVLRALGSAEPEEQAHLVLSAISGLLLKQLANPRDDFVPAVLVPSLRRLVAGLVD